MSFDPRRERSSSKRKVRDGPEEALCRKKHQRKAADSDDEDMQYEDFGSGGEDAPSKSSRKSTGKSALREEKDYPSVNDLKRRIRDVKRLLNKSDLPADARILQERALAGYEEDLAQETARRERSTMIKKYHFVRFLDRKTATKQLNRLLRREKEGKLDSQKKSSLERKIHAARVNLNYTIYYPLTEKYIALYPKSKGKDSEDAAADSGSESDDQYNQKDAESEKPALWSVVEKCMKEETLDRLREGKLNIGPDGNPVAPSKKAAPSAQSKKPKAEKPKSEKTKNDKPKYEPKNAKQDEAKPTTRRERRADKRDQYGQREHQRLQGKGRHHVAAPADGDESDGGFFE
ncbi:hypothetical protein N7532_003814 [Penicillium argentinense]|uniref:rRNA-processing protein EFG1 n=1 Tax=Penicillium argentinense TaxID=1131581 RepID=A0A9W9FN62_9EURO|nr:uncharacterized protein N7532_003814 [Penicillium argentinense]KAJ5103285.1 hypothetical protein N7532_003814 [Penicillium argentinense]